MEYKFVYKPILRERKTTILSKIYQFVMIFILGITIGFIICYLIYINDIFENNYNDSNEDYSEILQQQESLLGYFEKRKHYSVNKSIADEMYKKIRVLCWIMTAPKNHEKKARHVKATWGKRCNILLFMSSEPDDTLPAIALPVAEGRRNLWAKTKEAFRYVYKNHRNDADWFLKADDDTYVIMENLRYMLMPHNSSEPLFFGCRFKPFVKQGYMSGGAGYVLSGESLRRFVDDAIPNKTLCLQSNTGTEDVEIGKCLERVGVLTMDTRDSFGRGRFFPFLPEYHLVPTLKLKDHWYWDYIYYENKQGIEECSEIAISFHYVTPIKMYVLEYFIYHLRLVGITYNMDIHWPSK